MWIFPSYLKSLWKYIRVEIMTISFFLFFLFPLDALMDANRCMYGVSALCQWEQIHVHEGRAGFLWWISLELGYHGCKSKLCICYHWLKERNLSHGAVYWKICDFFSLFPFLLADTQRDMKMRTTVLPCCTAVGPSTEYTPMGSSEAYKWVLWGILHREAKLQPVYSAHSLLHWCLWTHPWFVASPPCQEMLYVSVLTSLKPLHSNIRFLSGTVI